MIILAIEKEMPGVASKSFQPHLKSEAARVWQLYQAGVIRQAYFRQDRDSAVLVLECSSVDEAEEILGTLPLVQVGMISFEIIPLAPYPGFARLFATYR